MHAMHFRNWHWLSFHCHRSSESPIGCVRKTCLQASYGKLKATFSAAPTPIRSSAAPPSHSRLARSGNTDVYFGRGQTILLQRERIKRKTIALRRLQHQQQAA